MARLCKKCGEKLFPTDTFCGFCGETVEDVSAGMSEFSYAPRSLVGDDALTKTEREQIEFAKRKYMHETAASISPEKNTKESKEQKEQFVLSAEAMRAKKERLLAAKLEAEKKEAERKAAEEAARLEAERKEAERKAAEGAARLEAERREAERKAAEEIQPSEELTEESKDDLEIEKIEIEEPEVENELESAEFESEEEFEAVEESESEEKTEFEEEPEPGEEPAPIPVVVPRNVSPVTDDKTDMNRMWEEAEKRAKAEQREADRLKRKRRLNEKPKHLTRDIVLLSIGIVVLIILLVFLLQSELKGVKGNDSNLNKGTEAGQQVSPEADSGSESIPADYGKPWDGSVATAFGEGDGTQSTPYKITTGSQLAYLASEVNRGVNFAGVYFSLENDIDLAGLEWTPIGYYYQDPSKGDLVYSFNGAFNGNGYKIYNYKISTLEVVSQLPNFSINKVCGLFGTTHGATITDLTVEQCTIDITETGEGEILAGALVGCAYDTKIVNCNVTADVKASSKGRAALGIVAGAMSNGNADGVTVNGSVTVTTDTGMNDAGLVSGYAKGTGFANIKATGNITAKSSANLYAGGVVGYGAEVSLDSVEAIPVIIAETLTDTAKLMAGGTVGFYISGQDVLVNVGGTITATGAGTVYAGGAYGYAETSSSEQLTAGVTVEASTTGTEAYAIAGGVYGYFTDSTLTGTTVSGSVTGTAVKTSYCGGIAGQGNAGGISGMISSSNVSASAANTESGTVMCGGATGNIVGVSLTDITVTGNVTVTSQFDGHAGGVSGYINGGTYTNVTASGVITNTSTIGVSSGGFAGYAAGEYVTDQCTGTTNRTNTGENVYDDDFIAIIAEGENDAAN
ncbi:MAG: hypothetical protein IJZ25_00310 [Lachnospiraceae bacterium]|nr:hypothetical protein [Lachnospiraceae bacterium]